MGIKDVIETVKKPTTLFFDGEYYNSVDELLSACNITRSDYTQVKATHRDWDAMNVVDFLVKSNKGILPSKNPANKAKPVESTEPVINVLGNPDDQPKETVAETDTSDDEEYVPVTDEELAAEALAMELAKAQASAGASFADAKDYTKADDKTPEDKADAKVDTEVADTKDNVKDDVKDDATEADDKPDAKADEKADVKADVKADDISDAKADDKADESKVADTDPKDKSDAKDDASKNKNKADITTDKVDSVDETAKKDTKEDKTTMNEYDYTQGNNKAPAKAAPAPSGSTAKAFDELLTNLNIAKEGYLVVKQVQSDMSELDIVNAILTTKGNPVGETSKDFDELLANLNTPKIGFQLVKQIHSDWSDLDVINAIIKSR